MSQVALPLLFAVFIWWFSTGAILYLDGLPARTFKWTMLGTTVLLSAALAGMAASSTDASPNGAYCGFTCAILVWAWQEVAFLLGFVTGPRREPCTPGATGWARTGLALQTVLHHELALLVLAGAVLAVTWGAPNQTAWWTYVILWAMRQSAKLNVFLGVRNLNESFLPEHLKYLQTYFTRKRMNWLFPWSVGLATLAVIPVWRTVYATSSTPFESVSAALVASLLSLAILEHWFLVLPMPSELLWKWGMVSRDNAAQPRPVRTEPVEVPR